MLYLAHRSTLQLTTTVLFQILGVERFMQLLRFCGETSGPS